MSYVDHTSPIWDTIYEVAIPQSALMSIEEVQQRGTYTTGIQPIDEAMAERPTVVWLNIDKIYKYFSEGYPIKILRRDDTIAIYEAIYDYLHIWHNHMTIGSLNNLKCPAEDLIGLDELAGYLYTFIGEEYKYGTRLTSDVKDPLNPLDLMTIDNPSDKPDVAERESLADFFSHHVYQKGL